MREGNDFLIRRKRLTLFSKRNATFLKFEKVKVKKVQANKIIKTIGQGHWPRGTRENGQINVAFLLEKSV